MLQNRPVFPVENQNHFPAPREIHPNPPSRFARVFKGGFIFLLGFIAFVGSELFLPGDYKPSALVGGFEGDIKAKALLTELEATRATIAAQNDQNIRMQQEVEHYRARLERRTEAYKILYQRTNIMAQAYANVEQQYLTMRQEFVQKTQEGKIAGANLAELVRLGALAFGKTDIAQSAGNTANQLRNEAMQNVDAEARYGKEQMAVGINGWQTGLIDPADMIREDEIVEPMKPAPREPAPPKPRFYQDRPPTQPIVTATLAPPSGASASRRTSTATARMLARINDRWPEVFIRSEPKGGQDTENKICVLSPGAVVNLLEDRSFDPDKKIMFAHVRFPWQGHGEASGWISEKALEEFSGSGQDGKTPQRCELPKPDQAGEKPPGKANNSSVGALF